MMGQMGNMAMNPTDTAGSLMGTVSSPQKMAAGFVGPTAAGIKQPPPASPGLKPPQNTAMAPKTGAQLQQAYTTPVTTDGSGMSPELMQLLMQLSGGRG